MSPLEQAVVQRKHSHLHELLTLLREERSKPLTYADTFQLAGQHGLITVDLAQRLIPAAGLRNRLAHDYEAIDPSRVHAALPIAFQDLSELAEALAARVRI